MNIFRGLISLALISSTAWLAGCASSPKAYQPLPTLPQTDVPATSSSNAGFTDDESRELVLQTRDLLKKRELNYLVGADDVLEINIFEWQNADQRDVLSLRVSKKGEIAMPGLGAVAVAGLSVEDIQKLIVEQLSARGILADARVGVSIADFRSKRVSVVGSVIAPGVYALTENVASLLEIISLAGGPNSSAGNRVYVLRKRESGDNPLQIEIDLDELFRTGSASLDAVLSNGDTVYIPKAPTISIYGEVRSPGTVSIGKSLTVMEAIASSGGLTDEANKSEVRVERKTDGKIRKYSINLGTLENSGRGNLALMEGDIIYVGENESKATFLSVLDFFRGIFSASYRLN